MAARSTTFGVALASVFALAFAFTLEYLFGVAPCTMCIWERWFYVAVIALAFACLPFGRERLALALMILILLGNAVLSSYHVGVEEGVFALPNTCQATIKATTIEELRAQLANTRPTCDQAALRFLGISLAGWNGLYAAALAGLASLSLVKDWRRGR